MTNYAWTAAYAAEHGPDAAIEANAQCFDAICPGLGLGDLLRALWRDLRDDLLVSAFRLGIASVCGADDELAYFAGPA